MTDREQSTNEELKNVDYKNVELLRQFLNPHGRLLPRKKTQLTAQQQRRIAQAVKRARYMGLLPYVIQ